MQPDGQPNEFGKANDYDGSLPEREQLERLDTLLMAMLATSQAELDRLAPLPTT